MKRARSRGSAGSGSWLRAIIIAYFALACAYALSLPRDDLPDESAHFLYIEHLLNEGTLPEFTSGAGNYEAHQPPFYYLLASPLVALARAVGGLPSAQEKAARLVSVLAGGLVVLGVYRVLRRAAPQEEGVAELGAAFAAFLPSRLLVSAALGNDALAEVFFVGTAWALLCMSERMPNRAQLLALGVAVGLGVLTKVSAVILLVVAPLGVLMASRNWSERPSVKSAAGGAGIVLGAALLTSAWWFLRNQHLYGDPLGMGRFVQIFTLDRPGPAYFAEKFGPWLYPPLLAVWTFKSSLGVFGQANRFLPSWAYAMWLAVCLVALAGAVRQGFIWLRRRETTPAGVTAAVVLGLEMALTVGAFIRFNMVFFQAQARYLGPAIAGWAWLWSAGVLVWAPRHRTLWLARVICVALALAGLLALLHGGEPIGRQAIELACLRGLSWGAQ